MGIKRPEEETRFILENAPLMTKKTLAKKFEAYFGKQITVPSITKILYMNRVFAKKDFKAQAELEQAVVWSREPEKSKWFLENDYGQCTGELSEAFFKEFGFHLSRTQISLARQKFDKQRHRPKKRTDQLQPIGTEHKYAKGYTLVKIREYPSKSGTKDNWEYKHIFMWEKYHNKKLPEGHVVVFANRDNEDFSKENLVAIPRKLLARVNTNSYHDAESLKAVIALESLRGAVLDVDMQPRKCKICGKEFVPRIRGTHNSKTVTCPDCVDSGIKYRGEPKTNIERMCHVCGDIFIAHKSHQKRCPSCIAEYKKIKPADQRRIRKNRGLHVCDLEEAISYGDRNLSEVD